MTVTQVLSNTQHMFLVIMRKKWLFKTEVAFKFFKGRQTISKMFIFMCIMNLNDISLQEKLQFRSLD